MSTDSVCRGSYQLGTACGHCLHCENEKAKLKKEGLWCEIMQPDFRVNVLGREEEETLRRCKVFEYQLKIKEVKGKSKRYHERTYVGWGWFRQFGVDYEELDCGVGNYSTAIVEMEDRTVKNISVENIEFVLDLQV